MATLQIQNIISITYIYVEEIQESQGSPSIKIFSLVLPTVVLSCRRCEMLFPELCHEMPMPADAQHKLGAYCNEGSNYVFISNFADVRLFFSQLKSSIFDPRKPRNSYSMSIILVTSHIVYI